MESVLLGFPPEYTRYLPAPIESLGAVAPAPGPYHRTERCARARALRAHTRARAPPTTPPHLPERSSTNRFDWDHHHSLGLALKFAQYPEYQGVYVLPDAVFSPKDSLN